jgi:hypothetical protein
MPGAFLTSSAVNEERSQHHRFRFACLVLLVCLASSSFAGTPNVHMFKAVWIRLVAPKLNLDPMANNEWSVSGR